MAMTEPRASGTEPDAPPTDFAAFYRDAWPGAVKLAGLLTQDARTAEDLAQEAFTKMYPKWSRIEHPQAYLRTAIVNACRSSFSRAHTERVKLPLVDRPGTTEIEFDELADAVAALPFRQHAVLVLRYHADLSEQEIADALGCRPGTVKSLASRALDSLKKGIEQ